MSGHPALRPRSNRGSAWHRRLRVLGTALTTAAALLVMPTLAAPASAAAVDPCGPNGNKISCENSKPGTPASVWDNFYGAGSDTIQGFATDISVNVGHRIDFKIDTDASSYAIDIYRIGYYQGNGARKITSINPSVSLPQNQPPCITDPATELYDCGNWAVSASWDVPTSAVSGVYMAHLQRSNGDASHVTFVVRDDASTSDVVFQTSDTTWQAYNDYGGSNFYWGGANGRAHKLSYNRPVTTRDGSGGRDFFFSNEYPMVRFLERNGYDVSYIAGVDTHRRGELLTNHEVFLSVGHDEYWSGNQRANVKAARDAGVHLQFLSGNEMYWRTRYEPSTDPSRTPYRTLVSYKETWGNGKIDPSDEWTGTWRDPRFAGPARGGGMPENGLIGTQYQVNFSDLALQVSAAEGKYRLWRDTSLATLAPGTSAQLAPHTVGYESNEDVDNGFRPPGLVRLSTTTGAVPEYLQDFGNTVAPGDTTHHLTLYRAASGALVFSAGTVQWTWGLDGTHDSAYAPEPADPRMQQAQVNLFADMGVQPVNLHEGLVAATASSDTEGPVVSISSPASGQAQKNGDRVTVTGTASDAAGRVAGVEVSTDGGASWRRAEGTTEWTFTYIQHGRGTTAVLVRAIDDGANIGEPTSRSFDVRCPCSIFGATVPAQPSTDDVSGVELGTRFTPQVDGFVTGIRFYKGAKNTGTHTGSLWTATGERLAQVTFTDETTEGWQTASLANPVPVSADQTYTVSYTAPDGGYAADAYAFAYRGYDAHTLRVAGGFGVPPGGVYGSPGVFPTSSFQSANYYADVTFSTTDDSPLVAINHSPAPDATAVPVNTTVSAKFSKPLTPGTATLVLRDALDDVVPGTTNYDTETRVITFTPDANLADFVVHTATVTGTDTQGVAISGGDTWSFRTAKPPNPPGVCPCSLFSDETTPTLLEADDPVPVTLGTRFTSDDNGVVTAIRFYKGPNNTGVHTGTLWNQHGSALATGTFTDELPSGWQQMTFDTPVPISKNTTYTVSYRAPNGRYSATPNAFADQDLSWPPLRVTSMSGAYTYGTGFPSSSSPTSYLVDVVFEKPPPSIAMNTQEPAPGALDVPRKSKVKLGFTAPIQPGWSLAVENTGTPVPGSVTLDEQRTLLTWVGDAALPADTDITVTLAGVVSEDGAVLGTQTWTFRTRSAETTSNQTLFGDVVPAVAASSDGVAVELGTAFSASRDGAIKAIRFFKGPGNDGTHVGSLWTPNGNRLASVEFTGETANGWQTAQLATPVPVTAGNTYVVSYLAPQGRYATTSGFFDEPWTNGDLTAPANGNGRYIYGSAGGYPTYSFGATNYFVDVLFERAVPTLTVVDRKPSPGATEVSLGVKPSLRVSSPLAPGWSMSVATSSGAVAGTAALVDDGERIVFTPDLPLAPETDHTITVTGLVSTEDSALADQGWSFRTGSNVEGLTSLFTEYVPQTAATSDDSAIELGVAFTSSVAGSVTAIKFYKGEGNSGTHTGSVWSASGQRLVTVTFSGETATGWQTAQLETPLQLQAGTTYVVSYFAPNGRYAATPAFFDSAFESGPLSVAAGSNGRYRYGADGGFPDQSWNATNYFVDLVFAEGP